MIVFACNNSTHVQDKKSQETYTQKQEEIHKDTSFQFCGITLKNNFHRIDTLEVKKNSLFNNFFFGYQISDSDLLAAITRADSLFSLKKIRSGQTFNIVYHLADKQKVADYFIYHEQPNRRLVVPITNATSSLWFILPTDTVERNIASRITRTLYNSILDAGASYDLGIKLAEVFAWQVDFFKIDKNDYFKVIYDEYHVDGETIGIGKIKAAEFYHKGDTFYAFNFFQDSTNSYFDQNGKSLRKAFLKAPLKYTRISSRYTLKRFHPVQKRWKAHLGTDYAAAPGTPIHTVGDGVIIASGYTAGNGNYVKVKHNETYTTQYLHMSKIARISRVGNRVNQGDVIGYVGSTGLATGPHLCFRFWKNGVQIDPFTVKIPPSIPIHEELKDSFESYRDAEILRLSKLSLH
ncbi:MAG: peptidoglycan DD-metalloendopeptidase family protein [Bacteroidetes bacterium]|nr:peptidoglycan DD-metalloendopeptidase family protein [Bacteroidota bacterium]